MSLFYDHLTNLSEIDRELEELIVEHHEKAHLLEIVDSALHHSVMETILTELPAEHHQHFLREFAIRPHDKDHLVYLIQFSPDIESKIRTKAESTKKKFKEEIKKAKGKKK
jgi:hypothetical protein